MSRLAPDRAGAGAGFDHLFDDAALFPPAQLELAPAVAAHLARRKSPAAAFAGRFVCPLGRLGELAEELEADAAELGASVVVPPGVVDPGAALDGSLGANAARIRLRAVELAPDEPAATGERVKRLAAYLDGWEGSAGGLVEVFVESAALPPPPGLLELCRSTGVGVKLRTGGPTPASVPPAAGLASALSALAGAGLPFKCTAGLHHAVAAGDPGRLEHHGVVNLLLATLEAGEGAASGELAATLGETDPDALAERLASSPPGQLARARERLRAIGTCSIEEPLEELARLGLLA